MFACIAAFPCNGWCCEPIFPLFQLLSGSSAAGPALLMHSMWWLVPAIVIKCGTFALFERRLSWGKALLFMLVANVISTIPGVLIGLLTSSIGGALFAFPLVAALGWMVQSRLTLLPAIQARPWISGGGALIAFFVVFFVSVVIYRTASGALEDGNSGSYWIHKYLFVTLVACTGMLISAVVEECMVARLARRSFGNLSFYKSVLRANYVTLGIVLLVAALQMLPKRLQSPDFLASWLRSLSTMLGLG